MPHKPTAFALSLLLALFACRVLAQLIQVLHPVAFLPAFGQWQSGALPYPVLLLSQLLIMGGALWFVVKLQRGQIQAQPRLAPILLGLAAVYALVMFFRLFAGLTFATGHPWLDAPLPSVVHLVLAAFLFVCGLYHSPVARQVSAVLIYPVLIASSLLAYHLLRVAGASLLMASYIPVIAGAVLITLLERVQPARREWQGTNTDMLTDASYMVLVQILLPRLLGLFATLTLLDFVQQQQLDSASVWPQHWPLYAQVLLMLLSADFLRYWMHRLAHEWTPLWQLHAVHHSPDKLYWLNVGRFHPLEKALQYLLDALPFMLLGVTDEVLALYFVFYAVNGFFQHCNIDVKLGYLNYLVSGPELHRWHHSKLIRESNNNYGNNLIVWDLLFGTRFLPDAAGVEELGLINRHYPQTLRAQLLSPFRKGLDKAG